MVKWTKPKGFSKTKVDYAGSILSNKESSAEKINEAIEIVDNWRAIHSYPMHVFKIRLKRISEKIDASAVAVQRLKRIPSILTKLNRIYSGTRPTMNLSQMQDIAGCRVVMSTNNLAKKLHQEFFSKGIIKHKKVNEKDYITYPKEDGYRGIHLIYRYNSDKKGKKEYNGLLVEIQIRSKLQHLWATAVETVDLFTRQAIKSNEGEKEWTYFFKLISSAFALMEKCVLIPNTITNKKKLYSEIKRVESELQVIKKMKHWTTSIRLFKRVVKDEPNIQLFLLELDTLQEKLSVSAYPKSLEEKALSEYAEAEKKTAGKKEHDIVLVGADNLQDLEKAYPNYFVDTNDFLKYLSNIIEKEQG